MKQVGPWFVVFSGTTLIGWIVGATVDAGLRIVSFYDLSAPNEYMMKFTLGAIPLGTCAGALLARFGRDSSCAYQRLVIGLITSLVGILLCATMSAFVSALAAKGLYAIRLAPISQVPIVRVWFCNGLIAGSRFGALVVFTLFVGKLFAKSLENADSTLTVSQKSLR